MKNLIWLHEEMLRLEHPIFEVANSNAHTFFIWDEKHFINASVNFERLVFIYETLLELPVTIYQGDARDIISKLSYKFGVTEVFTPDAKSIALRRLFEKLKYTVDLNVIEETKLFRYDEEIEYMRFFQFWRAIENRRQLLSDPMKNDKREIEVKQNTNSDLVFSLKKNDRPEFRSSP